MNLGIERVEERDLEFFFTRDHGQNDTFGVAGENGAGNFSYDSQLPFSNTISGEE